MKKDYRAFEKKWFIIFMAMYVFIMIPFPFFYSESYIPSIKGIPLFLIGWCLHTLATFVLIVLYAKEALERKEYKESYYLEGRDDE